MAAPKKASTDLSAEAFAAGLPPKAPLMGLDLGTVTIGLALSDIGRQIASPLRTIARTKFTADARDLLAEAAKHQVAGLVLGLPLNMDGSEGPRVQATRAFVRNLSRLDIWPGLPIVYWDERLSTVAAERALLEADTSRKKRRGRSRATPRSQSLPGNALSARLRLVVSASDRPPRQHASAAPQSASLESSAASDQHGRSRSTAAS